MDAHVIFMLVVFGLFIGGIMLYERAQLQLAERMIARQIEEAGGIVGMVVRHNAVSQSYAEFDTVYQDGSGMMHKQRCTVTRKKLGSIENILWHDMRPMQTQPLLFTSSKEQIITDLDAEIQRLNVELETALHRRLS